MSVVNWKSGPWWPDEGEKGPDFRKLAKLREERMWKREVAEEMAEEENDATLAYVVVNEFVPLGSDVAGVEDLYYTFSEDDAWGHLSELAAQYGLSIEGGDDSFQAPPTAALEEDSYYIKEIEIHG